MDIVFVKRNPGGVYVFVTDKNLNKKEIRNRVSWIYNSADVRKIRTYNFKKKNGGAYKKVFVVIKR